MAKWTILAILALLVIALVSVVLVTAWVQTDAPFRKERLVSSELASALILRHQSNDANSSDGVTMGLDVTSR